MTEPHILARTQVLLDAHPLVAAYSLCPHGKSYAHVISGVWVDRTYESTCAGGWLDFVDQPPYRYSKDTDRKVAKND